MRWHWTGPSRRGAALAALVLLLGAGLVGGLLRVRVDTGTESFLPADDPTLAAVEQRARDFGGDPVIVLLRYGAPRRFLTDHDQLMRLLRTEGQLARLPDVATVYGPATVLNQLAGAAQGFLAEIAGTRDGLRAAAEQAAQRDGKTPDQARAAGTAAVAQFDLRYAPLVVRGLPVGLPTLRNPRFGEAVIFGPDGQAKPEWRFIVPAPDTVAVLVRPRQDLDQAGTQRLLAAVRATLSDAGLATTSVTISGVPAVTAALAGEVTREAPLLGGLVAVVVLARFLLLPSAGRTSGSGTASSRWGRRALARRVRPLLATLLGGAATLAVLGWVGRPLSLAAALLLPLLLGVGSSFPLYLATVPNRRRVVVMSLASAAAFAALALSPLPFVRDLGLALAAGLLITVAFGWLLGARPDGSNSGPLPAATAGSPGVSTRRVVRLTALLVAVALAVLGWAVLPRLGVRANPMDLASGLPAIRDARTVESVLGASGEIGIELRGPDVTSPAALDWARAAHESLRARHGDQLRPVVSQASLLGFLGADPTPEQVGAALRLLPSYLSSSVIRPDHQAAVLVYGVAVQDLGAQRRMLAEVRAALPIPPPGYRGEVVGLPVAAARGYQLLLHDRYLANLAGIAVVGLVLVAGLRRRRDAARSVLAALAATGWGLALLWLLGVGLNPLTMALGALVSVTGCEFVVLLTEASRRGARWLNRVTGYACLTSVLGYLVLMASRLSLVREFALVVAAGVALSYLAAWLVVWLWQPTCPPAPDGTGARAGQARPPASELVEVTA
jgi:uncharacterized protein